jgi:hypothetical protein
LSNCRGLIQNETPLRLQFLVGQRTIHPDAVAEDFNPTEQKPTEMPFVPGTFFCLCGGSVPGAFSLSDLQINGLEELWWLAELCGLFESVGEL